MSRTVDLGSHALAYARAGLEVLPLVPGGKLPHPLARHAKDSASADVEQVRDWWVQAPEANIGIRPAAGVVVLDVDPRHDGALNLVKLTRPHGGLIPTWTAWTGGGGIHAWFAATGTLRSKLCEGVDLKSRSGYVVVPPSLHVSGQRYRWINTPPVAPAPDWLLHLVRQPERRLQPVTAATLAGAGDEALVKFVSAAKPGERNDRLYWAAMRAVEGGRLTPDLKGRITAAAVEIGLTPHEFDRTLDSALLRRRAVA